MTIDSCYQDVIAKLTAQGKIRSISQKLLSLTINHERVLYVYDVLGNLNVYPTVLLVTKTDTVSIYYRNHGNLHFRKGDNYKALQYYNLSLLHAPVASNNYCLALANRSAVLFFLKKYNECAKDINNVFSMKYPENLTDKLVKRQKLCEENLLNVTECKTEADQEINSVLTMKGSHDTRYICASSKLKVLNNKEMGRHIVAKEDICVGEVLAQEDPYFTLLLKSQYLFSCNYCLSRQLNLSPCDHCCFVLYCSDKCKKNAWDDYHAIECPLMASLLQMEFTKLELLALRTVIKARNDHTDWHCLFKTIKDAEANVDSEYQGHVKVKDKWIYDSKFYTSIHTLATNVEKRTISDIFQKCVTAAVFLNMLASKTDFMRALSEEENQEIFKCVAGTLLLHIMTSPTNMHGISSNAESAEGDFVEEISLASAPYAFHSLLNHSCAPNVVRFSKLGSGKMTLFALRPIKKGQQLFDNYGSHHAIQEKSARQDAIKFQYKFTCLCEACVNDWPIYINMNSARNLPLEILKSKEKLLDSDTIGKLQKGDKATALKLFKPLCKLAEVLETYAPCVELADCQETLKQCLVIFQGLVPYGYNQLVQWDVTPTVEV